MVKTRKITVAEAERAIKDKPTRQVGKWAEVCKAVADTGLPVEVTDITRGQVAAVARKAKDVGLRCVTWYKEGKCIVMPAEE